MTPRTGDMPSSTETPQQRGEEWQEALTEDSAEPQASSLTPTPPPSHAPSVIVYSGKTSPHGVIRVMIDIRQEEKKAKLRYYNQAARGEFSPSQPSNTPL